MSETALLLLLGTVVLFVLVLWRFPGSAGSPVARRLADGPVIADGPRPTMAPRMAAVHTGATAVLRPVMIPIAIERWSAPVIAPVVDAAAPPRVAGPAHEDSPPRSERSGLDVRPLRWGNEIMSRARDIAADPVAREIAVRQGLLLAAGAGLAVALSLAARR